MKKLEDKEAKLIKDIISEKDTVIEMDGKRYYISLIEESQTKVNESVEADPDIRREIEQTKKNILNGKDFAIDDVVEMIDLGKL